MNISDKRKTERYAISEYIRKNPYGEIFLDINADRTYNPDIVDISLAGLGFTLAEDDSVNLDNFNNLESYFLGINFKNKRIIAEVKKAWSIITLKSGNRVLTGGVFFSLISSEDRLIIAEYIKTIRS